jgi:hypothetical protein
MRNVCVLVSMYARTVLECIYCTGVVEQAARIYIGCMHVFHAHMHACMCVHASVYGSIHTAICLGYMCVLHIQHNDCVRVT